MAIAPAEVGVWLRRRLIDRQILHPVLGGIVIWVMAFAVWCLVILRTGNRKQPCVSGKAQHNLRTSDGAR